MSTKDRSGFSYIGEGIAWFLVLTGFGGCCYLMHKDSEKPLIVIVHKP